VVFIIIAACLKPEKSNAFTPKIGYSSKNGIIFSVMSNKFSTQKSPVETLRRGPLKTIFPTIKILF
jgi:hypothetical protein